MAPRLSRWISMTAVAAALVAVLFLTTGGTPLLFMGYGNFPTDETERTTQQRRIEEVEASLVRVRDKRAALEAQTLLAAELRRSTADPVAFTKTGNTLVLDRALTARLDTLWGTLPARRSEVRTVVLFEPEPGGWYHVSTTLDPSGLCIVRRPGYKKLQEIVQLIRWRAGACLLAESYGRPGAGVIDWMKEVRKGLQWDHAYRMLDRLVPSSEEESQSAAWFVRMGEPWYHGSGWRYRPLGRSEMACLVGRAGECEAATGVAGAGWPDLGPRWGYIDQRFPVDAIPRDLLTAIGPDRFEEVWTSPDPIATSYARVTGTPMEGWLHQWTQRYVTLAPRDNGLSLLGWVGAFLWLILLGGLTLGRLKQRSVT